MVWTAGGQLNSSHTANDSLNAACWPGRLALRSGASQRRAGALAAFPLRLAKLAPPLDLGDFLLQGADVFFSWRAKPATDLGPASKCLHRKDGQRQETTCDSFGCASRTSSAKNSRFSADQS